MCWALAYWTHWHVHGMHCTPWPPWRLALALSLHPGMHSQPQSSVAPARLY